MKAYMLGWHTKHSPYLCKERPNGIHGMQILLLRSKARIAMGDNFFNVEENTVFIIDSCYPHSLYGVGTEYIDDWIRFDLEDDDRDFLESLGIERNVPIKLDSNIVSDLIKICTDIFESDKSEKEETLRCLIKAIFFNIKSCCNSDTKKHRSQYENELDEIRRQIYDDPSADWSVAKIAQNMNLSVSHFQRLYKQRYGIPCMKDILTSRMEYAKQLLLTTELSTTEIAEKCGYYDYAHFSKVFSKYACDSPAKYRKNNR
ncbi:AraC family transcriptional regulator [Ruminococcus albus]|uniref:AraC-type DNA-binding protein n=1 Tax=Ruminococcus albus TaxID=1264 RepID=A0A1I1K2S2_RUMAL|nr:AraC family transcriptional regulator [Ruminococcus albus]SFC51910.1 AraC-type DNA-binding protein [Ruminococcus albus]